MIMDKYRIKVGDCDAEDCGYRCQEVCPQGVFLAVPREKNHEKHSANPRYSIVPRFAYFCDGCGECVPACSQKAIRVTSRKTGKEINQPVARS